MHRASRWVALLGALFALAAAPAAAQPGSGKPVRIVVSSAAGSTPDVVSRLLAQKMADSWNGSPVVVDNRPGALGAIAVENVMRSPADGSTLMFTDSAVWGITPLLSDKPPFDTLRDLQPVARVLIAPTFLVVSTKVPVSNVQELVAYAKKNPGKLTYGSPGNGSMHQLAAELFKELTQTDILHVPYKGAAQVGQAIMAGEIDIAFMGYTGAAPAIDKGAARIYGVTNEQRLARMNTIPTMQELGVKGMVISASMGFFAPSGLPREVNAKLYEAIAAALQNPEVVAKFDQLGLVPALQAPDAFTASIKGDLAQYAPLIKRAHIRVE
jgi:tripartite-type tricarboxylate transporter receptor subunit TctC